MTRIPLGVCYASHYIQIGSSRTRWAGVRRLSDGSLALEAFDREQERTIFVSGTIRLYNETCPLCDTSDQDLSMEELVSLLNNGSHWEMDLAKTM